jgi:hypothetical protein
VKPKLREVRAFVVLALAACGGAPARRATTSSGDAVVVLHTNVADSQVWVDGRLLGPLRYVRRGIALEPGHHRLELRCEDYFSRYAELDVRPGQRTELELPMSAQLP